MSKVLTLYALSPCWSPGSSTPSHRTMNAVLGEMASRLMSALAFDYGLFTMTMYELTALQNGCFNKGSSEKETLRMQLVMASRLASRKSYPEREKKKKLIAGCPSLTVHDCLWNLSRKYHNFSLQFLTLQWLPIPLSLQRTWRDNIPIEATSHFNSQRLDINTFTLSSAELASLREGTLGGVAFRDWVLTIYTH